MTEVKSEKRLVFGKFNQSATYLLPLLAKHVNIEFMHLLTNTFISMSNGGDVYDHHAGPPKIFLLYNTEGLSSDDPFFAYEAMLKTNALFQYDIPAVGSHALYVFLLPEEFNEDYDKFCLGQYSKFSARAKAQIVRFTEVQYRNRHLTEDIVGVLWKKKERRVKLEQSLGMIIPEDVELASICDLNKETLTL